MAKIPRKIQILPDEMILEILSRLPIESLSRFRGVSRSWCETIISRDPILNSKSKEPNRIARFYPETNKLYLGREEVIVDDDGKKRWTYSWDEKDLNSLLLLHSSIAGDGTSIIRLLASFEDLLLLSHGKHLLLLNPSIGRCRKVFDYPPLMTSSYHDVFVAGICYDSYSDDYKVLIGRNYCDHPEFVVINLKSKASKPVQFPYNICALNPFGVVVDERIYFRAYGYVPVSYARIIYFDVIREEFMDLSVPGVPNAEKIPRIGLTLGIVDGCLAVTPKHGESRSEGFVDIWVMRKHGVEESWMIFFTISMKNNPDLLFFRPLFVTKDGRLVVVDNTGITMFNLKDKNNSDVGVPCIKARDYGSERDFLQTVVAYNGGTSFPLDHREL